MLMLMLMPALSEVPLSPVSAVAVAAVVAVQVVLAALAAALLRISDLQRPRSRSVCSSQQLCALWVASLTWSCCRCRLRLQLGPRDGPQLALAQTWPHH